MKLNKQSIDDFLRKYLHIYLRVIFVANFLLLVVIATFSYFLPKTFEGTSDVNLFLVMTGSYWYAIMVLSAIGVFKPNYMEPIVILQLIYKSLYAIYFASGYNSYKFGPYGYIFWFFIPWVLIISVYLILKLFLIYNNYKKRQIIKDSPRNEV